MVVMSMRMGGNTEWHRTDDEHENDAGREVNESFETHHT